MKILYICHRFPFPPKRGGKIRPFNMIRHLARSHEVTVASLARTASEAEEAKGIGDYCQAHHIVRVSEAAQKIRMVGRLPTLTPSSMGYFYSPELAATVRRLLNEQKFDLIFVHCSSVAQYVSQVRGIPKILDFGDMDSQKWLTYGQVRPAPLSWGYWLEGAKLERAERQLAERFDLCTCTTRAELETLQGFGLPVATDWFPNGVDRDYFSPSSEAYDPDSVCFIGRMDYYPNQACVSELCSQVWPRIRQRRPDARLYLVGASPPEAIRRLGDLPGVTVTGSVADVRPYVRRCAAMLAPLRIARGTQNKILEAMSMGVPVVTSTLAAGGVDAVAGEHLLTADSPEAVAEATLLLMQDKERRSSLARSGRERITERHDWARSMQKLDEIIERCLAETGRSATAQPLICG